MNFFESHVSAALEQPQKGKVYLAAVSGGADSTAMLAALAALRKEAGFVLHCVHVEHGLRPAEESCGDAEAVEGLCVKLDVPCRVISIPPGRIAAFASNGGPGIEGAARFFRHRAWNSERRRINADRILTAHTHDDLLETLLMRILRGSGPAGLAPMPKNRGRITRPLLDLTRSDVLKYLEERNILYRTDSTNFDIHFLRNRIRHKLVPLLNEFFPSWQTSLHALADTQALTAEFLADEVRKGLVWEKGKGGDIQLCEDDFLKAHPILREEAIFAGVDMLAAMRPKGKGLVQAPRRAVLRQAARQIDAKPASSQDLGPVRLERRDGLISLKNSGSLRFERGFSLLIKEAGLYTLKGKILGIEKDLYFNAETASASPSGKSSPSDKGAPSGTDGTVLSDSSVGFYAGLPLVIRNHREGDRIYRGGHKRRFRDILGKDARPDSDVIISVCDAEGIAAFINIEKSGQLTVIDRKPSAGDTEAGRVLIILDIKSGAMNV